MGVMSECNDEQEDMGTRAWGNKDLGLLGEKELRGHLSPSAHLPGSHIPSGLRSSPHRS